ncbi:hypothetical protein PG985_002297 [Apiospora marii]|uniref:uncharacterized protein n=1 Tax=Apiospora marii TaxID=335849 RepID=UPI00312FCC7E
MMGPINSGGNGDTFLAMEQMRGLSGGPSMLADWGGSIETPTSNRGSSLPNHPDVHGRDWMSHGSSLLSDVREGELTQLSIVGQMPDDTVQNASSSEGRISSNYKKNVKANPAATSKLPPQPCRRAASAVMMLCVGVGRVNVPLEGLVVLVAGSEPLAMGGGGTTTVVALGGGGSIGAAADEEAFAGGAAAGGIIIGGALGADDMAGGAAAGGAMLIAGGAAAGGAMLALAGGAMLIAGGAAAGGAIMGGDLGAADMAGGAAAGGGIMP